MKKLFCSLKISLHRISSGLSSGSLIKVDNKLGFGGSSCQLCNNHSLTKTNLTLTLFTNASYLDIFMVW